MVAKYDDDWNWKCGFINTNGDLVVPMEYTTYWSFDNGIGAVSKGSGEDAAGALVDKNGKFLTDFLYSSIWGAEDGLVPVRTASGVITVLDSSTGKTVFTTKPVVIAQALGGQASLHGQGHPVLGPVAHLIVGGIGGRLRAAANLTPTPWSTGSRPP